jgi:hypothetical protein
MMGCGSAWPILVTVLVFYWSSAFFAEESMVQLRFHQLLDDNFQHLLDEAPLRENRWTMALLMSRSRLVLRAPDVNTPILSSQCVKINKIDDTRRRKKHHIRIRVVTEAPPMMNGLFGLMYCHETDNDVASMLQRGFLLVSAMRNLWQPKTFTPFTCGEWARLPRSGAATVECVPRVPPDFPRSKDQDQAWLATADPLRWRWSCHDDRMSTFVTLSAPRFNCSTSCMAVVRIGVDHWIEFRALLHLIVCGFTMTFTVWVFQTVRKMAESASRLMMTRDHELELKLMRRSVLTGVVGAALCLVGLLTIDPPSDPRRPFNQQHLLSWPWNDLDHVSFLLALACLANTRQSMRAVEEYADKLKQRLHNAIRMSPQSPTPPPVCVATTTTTTTTVKRVKVG